MNLLVWIIFGLISLTAFLSIIFEETFWVTFKWLISLPFIVSFMIVLAVIIIILYPFDWVYKKLKSKNVDGLNEWL